MKHYALKEYRNNFQKELYIQRNYKFQNVSYTSQLTGKNGTAIKQKIHLKLKFCYKNKK